MSTDGEETIMYPSPKRYNRQSTKFMFSVPPPPITSRKRSSPELYASMPLKMAEESDGDISPPPPPPVLPLQTTEKIENDAVTAKKPRIHMTQRQMLFTRTPGTLSIKMCSLCYQRSKLMEKPAEDVYSFALCAMCSKKNLGLRFE